MMNTKKRSIIEVAPAADIEFRGKNPVICIGIYGGVVCFAILTNLGLCFHKHDWWASGTAGGVMFILLAVGYSFINGMVKRWWTGSRMCMSCKAVVGLSLFGYICIFIGVCYGIYKLTILAVQILLYRSSINMAALSEEERAYFSSEEFTENCDQAFRRADPGRKGKLDFEALTGIVLFDLTPDEAERVKREALLEKAFQECDQNKDKFIDRSEFTEVMMFVRVHAKALKDSECPKTAH